jgi:hypothetical protein
MTRAFYRFLLWLHPPKFRGRFAEEMLWIYDETPTTWERTFLFCDGFNSLARQWVVRSRMWKTALGFLIALIEFCFLIHPY